MRPGLSAVDTGDGAALAVVLLLGTVVIGAVFRVEVRFDLLVWIPLTLWSTVALPFAVLLRRPLKLMHPLKVALIVQQHQHRATGMDL